MDNEELIMNNEKLNVGASIARPFRESQGITLIALIITIIVMLILAGVVLNLTIGERGIFKTAVESAEKMEEAEAREKLELVLLDLQTDKLTDVNYNENEYINTKIQANEMSIDGDIAIVDGWQFQIDRSVPEIGASLGKGKESQEITIVATVENATDYTKATIKIEITSTEDISSIQIGGEEITVPEKIDGKYVIEKEVAQNGNYTIYVKDATDGYKTATAKVTEISEDMDIYTIEQLVSFRDRVNKGATFEGRTVRLKNDLDLGNIEWIPIGYWISEDDNKVFRGIFDGEKHTINNMKINMVVQESDSYSGAGFIGICEGEIKNLKFNNPNVYSEVGCTGIVAGELDYGKIENVQILNGEVHSTANYTGGIVGANSAGGTLISSSNGASVYSTGFCVGGITGSNQYESLIQNCYNTGTVTNSETFDPNSYTGGIAGYNYQNSTIKNCYNAGDITADYKSVGGIVGVNGWKNQGTQILENVFNTGTIKKGTVTATADIGTSSNYVGRLIGYGVYNKTLSGICANTTIEEMQSWDEDTIVENLGESFKKNTDSNVNQGLPILAWQK